MNLRVVVLILAMTAVSCSSGGGDRRSPLVVDRSNLPAVGERGWNFEQTWTADLDGDGDRERVVVLAQVERREETLLWEDGHRWVVYVEEPDSRRTYLFSRLVPRGRLDVYITSPEEGSSPRVLILERGGSSLGLWEVRYRGRDKVEVKQLAERAIDASSFVGGTRER